MRWRLIAPVFLFAVAACSSPSHGTAAKTSAPSTTELATSEPAATSTSTATSSAATATGPPVTKASGCVLSFDPDSACTPGAVEPRAHVGPIRSSVDPSDPYNICASGYTKTIRPPVSITDHLKAVVAKRYGITDSLSNYEGDHLISLELGGAPEGDPANPDDVSSFWDEPHSINGSDGQAAGSLNKDKFENYLRRLVCAGQATLATAQHKIAVN